MLSRTRQSTTFSSDISHQSTPGVLSLAAAGPGELESVMSILAEASAALVARGIHQWPSPPPPPLWRLLDEQIALGLVYLARLSDTGLLAGTLRFTWEQPAVWPEKPGEAGYVHTLAIRPMLQGRQLGKALLAWAAGHVRARPRRFLRLDCVAASQPLRRYYEGLGFEPRGLAEVDGYRLARYELNLQQFLPSTGESQCT